MFFEIMNNNTSRNPSRVWNVLTIEFMAELYQRCIEPKQWYVIVYEILFSVDIPYKLFLFI